MTGDAGVIWRRAASLAARAHEGQRRKDGATPYVAHPFRVALTVRHEFGCVDDACLAAALLHDVIEDTPLDYDDVLEACGPETAGIVAALTKDMRLAEPDREPAYDAGLAAGDWRARLIKLADVLDNLRDSVRRGETTPLAKLVGRCRRAIDLASCDQADHPETAIAITLVEDAARLHAPDV